MRRLRSAARFVPFHRMYHSIELTFLILLAAVCDVLLGADLLAIRILVVGLLAAAVVTVVGTRGRHPDVEQAALTGPSADGGDAGRCPTYGVVILTMGRRPEDLQRAVASVLAQRDVSVEVVVVGNGWKPVGLPPQVRTVSLQDNVGIPAGRNAGVSVVRGDLLFFLDDDALLPTDDVLATIAQHFAEDPRLGLLQPRIADPGGAPPPRRWTPGCASVTRGAAATPRWSGRAPSPCARRSSSRPGAGPTSSSTRTRGST